MLAVHKCRPFFEPPPRGERHHPAWVHPPPAQVQQRHSSAELQQPDTVEVRHVSFSSAGSEIDYRQRMTYCAIGTGTAQASSAGYASSPAGADLSSGGDGVTTLEAAAANVVAGPGAASAVTAAAPRNGASTCTGDAPSSADRPPVTYGQLIRSVDHLQHMLSRVSAASDSTLSISASDRAALAPLLALVDQLRDVIQGTAGYAYYQHVIRLSRAAGTYTEPRISVQAASAAADAFVAALLGKAPSLA